VLQTCNRVKALSLFRNAISENKLSEVANLTSQIKVSSLVIDINLFYFLSIFYGLYPVYRRKSVHAALLQHVV
jgi:hypothetical protein